MELTEKIDRLEKIIKSYGSVAVAFSGGVDSTFLAYESYRTLGDRSTAITVNTIFFPDNELTFAEQMAKKVQIPWQSISLPLTDTTILSNPRDRCYHCKKQIFEKIRDKATELGVRHILDGSNLDDLDDFRPGMRAVKELGVISPLIEANFTKDEIRAASKAAELETWNLPSMACLASRVPYGQQITEETLLKIYQAEKVLREKGINQVRVRAIGEAARIEVAPEERIKFFDLRVMDEIVNKLKQIGFTLVSLDLEGYKTGKLNVT